MDTLNRFEGCLLGLACGDALGAAVEGASRGRFEPLTDIRGGGVYQLEPGQWTDDTSMALCLADSLLACGGFNAEDQMTRYWRWADEGYNSARPSAFGMGRTVARALMTYRKKGDPFAGATAPDTAGNGSLMRIAPIPMYYSGNPELARQMARDSSRTTHGAEECLAACEYFTALLVTCLQGETDKDALLAVTRHIELPDSMRHIGKWRFRQKSADEVTGSAYVVESLEAALWAFWTTDTFRDAILAAANLGDDADTTAAICGQIAGAFYTVDAMPADWLDAIYRAEDIRSIAGQLYHADAS